MIGKLFGSKKFIGLLVGLIFEVIVATEILSVDPAVKESLMTMIGGLTGTYLVGQGIADHGKEKAKVEKGQ